LTQVTSDTTDRELKTGLGRCGGGFLLTATSFSFSCGRCNTERIVDC
jgi:ribosomal protein S27AE